METTTWRKEHYSLDYTGRFVPKARFQLRINSADRALREFCKLPRVGKKQIRVTKSYGADDTLSREGIVKTQESMLPQIAPRVVH